MKSIPHETVLLIHITFTAMKNIKCLFQTSNPLPYINIYLDLKINFEMINMATVPMI